MIISDQLKNEPFEFMQGFREGITGQQRGAPYNLHTQERRDWQRGYDGGRYIKDNAITLIHIVDELIDALDASEAMSSVRSVMVSATARTILTNFKGLIT